MEFENFNEAIGITNLALAAELFEIKKTESFLDLKTCPNQPGCSFGPQVKMQKSEASQAVKCHRCKKKVLGSVY